jgi:amidase
MTQRHREWLIQAERRAQQRARWAEFFHHYDVLLCPVTCTAAFLHDHSDPFTRTLEIDGHTRDYNLANLAWCGIVGVAYLPSVVVPVGKTGAGLPVGVQVVGPYLEDRTALEVAATIEAVLGGFEAPPGY